MDGMQCACNIKHTVQQDQGMQLLTIIEQTQGHSACQAGRHHSDPARWPGAPSILDHRSEIFLHSTQSESAYIPLALTDVIGVVISENVHSVTREKISQRNKIFFGFPVPRRENHDWSSL